VVYVSRATDLIAGGNGGPYGNVYLWDRATNTTTLVSHAASAPLTRGNSNSDEPAISADGTFVTYESYSSDLTPGPGGELNMSIYLWHRLTDSTTLVSHAVSNPLVRSNGAAYEPVIDADGSSVAYVSHATDLISGGSGPIWFYNAYLWNRSTNETTLVSHAASDLRMRGDKNSYGPVIDADGSSVAYRSSSTDLIADASGGTGFNIYLWDRTTNATTLVSHAASGPLVRSEDSSQEPVISADGSSVAYQSWSIDLVSGGSGPEGWNIYLWERTTNSNRLVSHAPSGPGARGNGSSETPVISADGSSVAYRSRATDLIPGESGPVDENVYLWDRPTDTTTLVSHAAGAPLARGNGGSGLPAISADGSSLAYASSSTDLMAGGSGPGSYNVYHWDRAKDSTTLMSHPASDPLVRGNENSFGTEISADGLAIAFESDASDLVTRDFNLATDAFYGQPLALFLDGFESGDTLRWSAAGP
jgi:Tol biopolymer transport system component